MDGASEGGRINTVDLPGALVLYGVSLLERLRESGYAGDATVLPERVNGIWTLKVVFSGEPPAGLPATWHGHRVVAVKSEPLGAAGA